MPRKTKVEAEKTRARILASALSLFAKKGYERTTFTDIAARLKMTKGAVYWHFETKEDLLIALVREMIEKFHSQLGDLSAQDLTFLQVAETFIARACRIVEDPKGAAFFLLLQTQVKWRAKLLAHDTNGPYNCLIKAIENDIAAGRVRADVNPVALASVSMAVWTGLVRSKIEKFLECDLEQTLRETYGAMWESVKV